MQPNIFAPLVCEAADLWVLSAIIFQLQPATEGFISNCSDHSGIKLYKTRKLEETEPTDLIRFTGTRTLDLCGFFLTFQLVVKQI